MRPFQRRMLALCVFALSFSLFYEARGRRLLDIWHEGGDNTPSLDLFRQHAITGTIVLCMGGSLIFLLRRREEVHPFSRAELFAYALGAGLLIGTLIVSWMQVGGA